MSYDRREFLTFQRRRNKEGDLPIVCPLGRARKHRQELRGDEDLA